MLPTAPLRRLTSAVWLLLATAATAAATAIATATATATTAAAQSPAGREMTADQQVLHVLNRLAFGPRPGDVAKVRAMGVDQWVAAQLAPERIPDDSVASLLARYPTLATDPAELTRLYRQLVAARRRNPSAADTAPAGTMSMQRRQPGAEPRDPEVRRIAQQLGRSVDEVAAAKIARAVASERQLEQVMVDFWSNHFSIAQAKGQTRLHVSHYDREVIRPRVLGRFRDLLGAVAKSPAMLVYLDNAVSVADSMHATRAQRRRVQAMQRSQAQPRRPRGINENYARELLELHTLGADGGYSQQDVMEVARALTGWSIDPRTGRFVFRRVAHDAGPKVVMGTRLPGGRGIADGEEVLDLVARHPSTARFIARKLAVRFVSDSPPPALVERAAATFLRTDGDIREVLRTIITSDEFFSRDAYRAKVKTPFELVVSTVRIMGGAPDTTLRTVRLVARLGQPIYGRQTPDGWPETGAEWMNAGAILGRINFGLLAAGGRVPGVQLRRWPAAAQLAGASREAMVDAVVRELLGGDVSRETREVLVSGSNPLLDRPETPNRDMAIGAQGIQLTPAQQLVGLALGAPEFQRR